MNENITSIPQLRKLFLSKLGDSNSVILGNQVVPREMLIEAFEEVVGSMIEKYMDNKDANACTLIVGHLIIEWLEG